MLSVNLDKLVKNINDEMGHKSLYIFNLESLRQKKAS